MCGKLADKHSLKYRQSVEWFRRAAIKFHFLYYHMFGILCNIVLQEKRYTVKIHWKCLVGKNIWGDCQGRVGAMGDSGARVRPTSNQKWAAGGHQCRPSPGHWASPWGWSRMWAHGQAGQGCVELECCCCATAPGADGPCELTQGSAPQAGSGEVREGTGTARSDGALGIHWAFKGQRNIYNFNVKKMKSVTDIL